MRNLLIALLLLSPAPAFAQAKVRIQTGDDTLVSYGDSSSRRRSARRIPVTDEHRATAFKSPRARDLLLGARKARLSHDSALMAYDATTYQRISAGLAVKAVGR